MKHLILDYNTVKILLVNKDRQIAEAKKHALLMAEAVITTRRTDVKVLGKQALGMFLVGTGMEAGKYILSTIRKLLTN
jgi:3-hydroxyacyl-CoA dehydrogenase